MKKELKTIINKLTDVEFGELKICIDMANTAQNVVNKFKLTEEKFAKLMGLTPKQAAEFLAGTYDYDVYSIAKLNAVSRQLEIEELKKDRLVDIKLIANSSSSGY